MCKILMVRWTIQPRTAPQPWLVCSGCGGLKAFQASGKARLNANGRKLDAWLIYKCVTCEKTWNRPIFERQNVRDIDPAILDALQSNDPQWIRAETFNIDALRRKSQRVDEFAEFDVEKAILRAAPGWTVLEIELAVPLPIGTRLDRLLASELKMSRARLQALHDAGKVRANSNRDDILRRRVRPGTHISIDLSAEADRDRWWWPLATGRPM